MERAHDEHIDELQAECARTKRALRAKLTDPCLDQWEREQCLREMDSLERKDPASEYLMDFAQFLETPAEPADPDPPSEPAAAIIGLPINEKRRLGIKRRRRLIVTAKPMNACIDKFIVNKRVNNRGEIFHRHQVMIGKEAKNLETDIDFCPYCPGHPPLIVVQAEGAYVCATCGITRTVIENDAKYVPFGTITTPISESSYKRMNHYNEWLTRLEARQRTFIPPEVIEAVRDEVLKNRRNPAELTAKEVRMYLRKLKLSNFYEHRIYICCAINGKEPPKLSALDKTRLRCMFRCIQDPYERCPITQSKRENFLGYSYVLHKICELLEMDEFLVYFPIPKSREVLRQYEKIWRWICNDLGWDVIPCASQ